MREAPTEPEGETVAPDETGDGIAGAEPLKIELAIGKGKALMRCLSWRMTANRVGWGPRVCADECLRQTNTGYFLDATRCRLGNPSQPNLHM